MKFGIFSCRVFLDVELLDSRIYGSRNPRPELEHNLNEALTNTILFGGKMILCTGEGFIGVKDIAFQDRPVFFLITFFLEFWSEK